MGSSTANEAFVARDLPPSASEALDVPLSQFGISASRSARILDLGLNDSGLVADVVAVYEAERARALDGELGGLIRHSVLESFVESLSAFAAILASVETGAFNASSNSSF